MSLPLTPRERLSSIVEDKPIYSALQDGAALALVKLTDYDSWSFSEYDWLLTLLHGIHLRVDALVQQYGFYKVDFHCGAFTVAANISGTVDIHAPQLLLQFAEDVLRVLREVKLPGGKQHVQVQVSLTAGPIKSAILGKTALKYSVHGRPEVLARRLLKYYGKNGCIIASKDFVECLDRGMVMWKPLPLTEDASNRLRSERAFLYEQISQENASPNSSNPRQRNNALWRGLKLVPSLCFDDPEMEENFRLFQADRFAFLDVLYMSLSASMVGVAAVHAWRYGVSASSLNYLILSLIGAAIPLSGVVFLGEIYRQNRQSFLIFFRFIKLASIGLSTVLQPAMNLTPLLMNYAILHGMHAIGTQLVLPIHLSFQLLSVVVIGLKIAYLCDPEEAEHSIEGCGLVTSALILFIATLLIPSVIAYKVEKQQRYVYSHGSRVLAQKQS